MAKKSAASHSTTLAKLKEGSFRNRFSSIESRLLPEQLDEVSHIVDYIVSLPPKARPALTAVGSSLIEEWGLTLSADAMARWLKSHILAKEGKRRG